MHRIVIVGGGAGGLELAARLGNKRSGSNAAWKVTLIDRHSTHIWKPLLHELAAGSMDPYAEELSYAAQANWHGFEFTKGELTKVDREHRTLTLAPLLTVDGEMLVPQRVAEYDTLILAIGSTTAYFGVPGAAEHCIALDTPAQAEMFRTKMLDACIKAEYREEKHIPEKRPGADDRLESSEDKQRGIRIVIVGAGATGVELAAELRNTARVLSRYGLHRLDPVHDVGIVLLDGASRILSALSERVSIATARLLRKRSVEVVTGEAVAVVDAATVKTKSGCVINADIVVWAAGIKAPNVLSTIEGLEFSRMGQVVVDPSLRSTRDPKIFALGDCAACPPKRARSRIVAIAINRQIVAP